MKKILIKILSFTLITIFLISCKSDKEKYIQLYKDMVVVLKKYEAALKDVRKKGQLTTENHEKLLKYQKKVLEFNEKVKKYKVEYDNDEEVLRKLENTMITLSVTQLNIVRLQNKIKNFPGVKKVFRELQRRGSSQ